MTTFIVSHSQITVTATAATTGPTNYTTLKAAFAAVNAGTHQGAISVIILASTIETGAVKLNASGTGLSSFTSLLVKPAPASTPTVTLDSAIILDGADKVTFDGSNVTGGISRDLTITCTSLFSQAMVLMNGACMNDFKYTVFKARNINGGVVEMGPSNGATGNDNNIFIYSDITKGISSPLMGIVNRGSSGKPNSWNSFIYNRITDFSFYGFSDGDNGTAYSQDNALQGNEFFQTTAQTGNLTAIHLNNISGITDMWIAANHIHDLWTTVTIGSVTGIDITAAKNVIVENNMITLSGTANNIIGIAQHSPASKVRCFFNTVNIYGPTTPLSTSTCFLKTATSPDTLRNNIFVNRRVSSGTGHHFCVVDNAGSFTGLSSNYNSLFSNDRIGSRNGFDHVSLPAWITNTAYEINSVNENPVFFSSINLHLVTGSNSGLNDKAIPISSVFDDIDNDARNPTTPDLGADEMQDITPPQITYTPFPRFTCSTADRILTATIIDETGVPATGSLVPRIYYKKSFSSGWNSRPGIRVSGNSNSGSWNFTIASADLSPLLPGDTIRYFVIAQDNKSPSANVATFPAGGIALNVNSLTTPPSTADFYITGAAFSGTFTVGSGSNFSTLTAAINKYNNSCLTGPVVFNLTDGIYDANETFPLSVLANPFASTTNTLTIKPASGINATINSNSYTLLLEGASYVTIDGSNNSTSSKNLTISSTHGSTTVFGISFGGSHNVVRNTIIKGVGPGSDVLSIGGTSDTSASNYNLIENNDITKGNSTVLPQYGIIVGGDYGKPATGNIIRGNRISDFQTWGYYENAALGTGTPDNTLIESNEFFFTAPHFATTTAIYIGGSNAATSAGLKISKNNIHDIYTGFGATGIEVRVPAEISNNMISIKTDDRNLVGIKTVSSSPGMKVLYNTVLLNGSAVVSNDSYGYLKEDNIAGIELKNNIFYNNRSGPGNRYAIASTNNIPMVSDHNILYSPYIGKIVNTDYGTLLSWQNVTGGDLNSIYVAPVFVSNNNLHLDPASNATIDNKGTPFPFLSNDIDGDIRSITTPDIGADEMSNCIPSITTPNSKNICTGSSPNITLNSTIPGSSFSWATGTILNVSGATNGSGGVINQILNTVTQSDGTIEYIVTATSPSGCVSPPYSIIVNVNDSVRITVNPVSTSACDSGIISFSAQASGSAVVYQWRFNGVDIPGANSNQLTLNPILPASIGNYDVVATGVCGSKTSSPAVLSVYPKPIADFTIPTGNLCAGTQLTFINNSNTSPANMAAALWQFGDGGTSTSTSATVNHSYTGTGPFQVSLEVTSIYGCKSNILVKSITISPSTSITTQPVNQTGCIGGPVNFSIAASGNTLSYQWKKNNINIAGATSNTYTITSATLADVANYSIDVTGACGTVTSNSASFALMPVAIISIQPSDVSVCTGSSASLSVSASGSGLSYQWRKSGNSIAGATTATYTINPVTLLDFGSYDVVISNSCGITVTSSSASITMLPSPGNFLPPDTAICSYGKILLQSSQPYTSYTWSTGATTPTLLIEKPGTYWLQVRDNNNCSGRDSILVDPKECMRGVYLPNAFTPNNDGKNDFFKANVFGKTTSFKLEVFDRGGQLIFQTTDPKKQWDGSIKGSQLPTGVFVWICTYQLEGMRKEVQKGTVVMIR